MAAAVPPVGPGPPVPPAPAPITTFRDRFNDARYDTEHGEYGALMERFDPSIANALTADQLHRMVLQEPVENARVVAVHWQSASDPTHPGEIALIHGMDTYPASLGGGTTRWDNRSFCWHQDVVDKAAPTTMSFPGDAFRIAEPQVGVTNHRIYEAATLQTMFGADPALIVTPQAGAGDAGTKVIRTRVCMPVPFCFVSSLLSQRLNPRQFFLSIYPQIFNAGKVVELQPFVDWMCATCTARTDCGPGQVVSVVGREEFHVPNADEFLRMRRQQLLIYKLPALGEPTTSSDGIALANMIGTVTQELRDGRIEAKERAESGKTSVPSLGPPRTSRHQRTQICRMTKKRQVWLDSHAEILHTNVDFAAGT